MKGPPGKIENRSRDRFSASNPLHINHLKIKTGKMTGFAILAASQRVAQ